MNSGRIMNLLVTIPAESRRMNVGKDVIRVLGSPAYICVLQRKDRKAIAITPCAAEHPMSFKVPGRLLTDGQCRMMINGIQFIQVMFLHYFLLLHFSQSIEKNDKCYTLSPCVQ